MDRMYLYLRRIRFLIIKELLGLIKDPRSRAIIFVPVFIQSIIFGYAATYNLDTVPYALLDQSHSKYSGDLISKLDGTGIFQRTQTLQSSNQIADCIDKDRALLVLVIPADFADKLAAGQEAPVQVITDGRNSTTSGIALGYMGSIIAAYNSQLHMVAPPLQLETISWYNPNLITRWMFLPAMFAMLSLLQVIILSGLSVAREREQGTFDQLLVTPLTPSEILVGKAVPPLLIGLAQISCVFCITYFWFQVPFAGSFFDLYLTLAIFLLSCIGIGLSISAISNNMQQVMVCCFVLLLPMCLLSGLATPIRNMPELLQYATYLNPMRFALDAVRRIYLEGASLSTIAFDLVPMLFIAAITLPVAGWLFRHKLS